MYMWKWASSFNYLFYPNCHSILS